MFTDICAGFSIRQRFCVNTNLHLILLSDSHFGLFQVAMSAQKHPRNECVAVCHSAFFSMLFRCFCTGLVVFPSPLCFPKQQSIKKDSHSLRKTPACWQLSSLWKTKSGKIPKCLPAFCEGQTNCFWNILLPRYRHIVTFGRAFANRTHSNLRSTWLVGPILNGQNPRALFQKWLKWVLYLKSGFIQWWQGTTGPIDMG